MHENSTEPALDGQGKALVCLALSAGMYWSWWDSFHEMFRFKVLGAANVEAKTFLEGGIGYLQCWGKPLGIIVGCALVLLAMGALSRTGRSEQDAPRLMERAARRVLSFDPWLLVAQLLSYGGFCLFLSQEAWALAVGCYFVASALAVPSFVGLAVRFKNLEPRKVGWVIMSALVCYGTCSNLAFPLFLRNVPSAVGYGVYLVFLVAAFLLARIGPREASRAFLAADNHVYPPVHPAFHLIVYGLVFGMLHILEGVVQTGPFSVNLGVFWGCLIAVALFYGLYVRGAAGSHEIWSKMRSAVFPLVIVGYLLIPLAAGSDLALSFTEAGGLLYVAILFFACASLMWRTYVAAPVIVCWVLLLYSVGEAGGVLAMVAVDPTQLVEGKGYYGFSVAIVLFLTAATFWVGSDEQIRKLWGLRRDMSPRRFNDAIVRARVALLTRQYNLTPREADVLAYVANGRRAPEMADDMGVSRDTVRTHLKHLYTKLDVHSYADAARVVKETEVPDSMLVKYAEDN